MSDLPRRLRLLIPRLGSDADGEVLATVAAIRLAAEGRDLHDLAGAVNKAPPRCVPPTPATMAPSDVAISCLRTGRWREHEALFLASMAALSTWAQLSAKQADWLLDLHDAAAAREVAA